MSHVQSSPVVQTAVGPTLVHFDRFARGGGLCITLHPATIESKRAHSIARMSFNLGGKGLVLPKLATDEIAIKAWDDHAKFLQPLLSCGLFEDTGRRICVGLPTPIQVWRIKAPHSLSSLLNLH